MKLGRFAWLIALLSFFTLITFLLNSYLQPTSQEQDGKKTLKVLAYSSFVKTWGPGALLAKEFEDEHNVKIEWIEVENAGLILRNLLQQKAEQMPDVVLGLDELNKSQALEKLQWRSIDVQEIDFNDSIPRPGDVTHLIPIDWAPMTFITKRKIVSPIHLNDLLLPEYANSLGLQDPRSSATGLYFLVWILSVEGEDAGFDYLKKLKSSVRVVSPSWSASYGLFQNDQSSLVFSFLTSPLYHHISEKDFRYQPIYFSEPMIRAIEYVGIPKDCKNCKLAQKFTHFLLSHRAQKYVMEKNFMLPVVKGVEKDTAFDLSKKMNFVAPQKIENLLKKKNDLLKRWEEMGL